jgi:hypothetical protein
MKKSHLALVSVNNHPNSSTKGSPSLRLIMGGGQKRLHLKLVVDNDNNWIDYSEMYRSQIIQKKIEHKEPFNYSIFVAATVVFGCSFIYSFFH